MVICGVFRCWETNDNPIPNWVINGPIGFSIMVSFLVQQRLGWTRRYFKIWVLKHCKTRLFQYHGCLNRRLGITRYLPHQCVLRLIYFSLGTFSKKIKPFLSFLKGELPPVHQHHPDFGPKAEVSWCGRQWSIAVQVLSTQLVLTEAEKLPSEKMHVLRNPSA